MFFSFSRMNWTPWISALAHCPPGRGPFRGNDSRLVNLESRHFGQAQHELDPRLADTGKQAGSGLRRSGVRMLRRVTA